MAKESKSEAVLSCAVLQEDQEEYVSEEEEQDVFDSDFDDDVSPQSKVGLP